MPKQLRQQLSKGFATNRATFGGDDTSLSKVGGTGVLAITINEIAKVQGLAFGSINAWYVCELVEVSTSCSKHLAGVSFTMSMGMLYDI
jgi:hypothetical protein